MDRYDFPYIVWVINSNVQNLLSGNFMHYFDTRGFYPHPYGLLFSDILLPQALITLPLYLISKNMLLAFNIMFIITYILNFTSGLIFWRSFFDKKYLVTLGSFLIVFGPIYHMQHGHFQMQSYWLGLTALALYIRQLRTLTHGQKTPHTYLQSIFIGILMGAQFTASVYIFVFFSAWMTIAGLVMLIVAKRQDNHVLTLKSLATTATALAFTTAPWIRMYFVMKKHYGLERQVEEIIQYSAHMTDYLFTGAYQTYLYAQPAWSLWNRFDKHASFEKAIFPGFLLMIGACAGIAYVRTVGKKLIVGLQVDHVGVIFASTALIGFISSLGPRLSFNGAYGHIPSPYLIGLKLFPMLDGIRSPARWEILFVMGLIYFFLISIDTLRSRHMNIIICIIGVLLLIEYLPLPRPIYVIPHQSSAHQRMQQICSTEPQTLVLEYPVTHFIAFGGIVEGLGYISNTQLSQVFHNCLLMNGYSGFIPEKIFDDERELSTIIQQVDADKLATYLTTRKVDIIAINMPFVVKELRSPARQLIQKLDTDARFKAFAPGVYTFKP